jgi:hypothetical protein
MANYSSMSAILTAIRQRMVEAMIETVDKSFQDMHKNVDSFYSSAEGAYKRTGQLVESPQIDYLNIGGNSASAQLSLDTSYGYSPAGRDTMTIYNYGEDGGLLGNGGFWSKTESYIQKNMDSAFKSKFS